MTVLRSAIAAGLAAAAATAGHAQQDETITAADRAVAEARLEDYLAAGYDPLTVPVGWFAPTAPVPGGWRPDPRVLEPHERTLPDGALAAAAAYAADQNSLALIVIRGGAIEYERYWQGAGRDTRFNPQSMSKTVAAILVGAAIEDGDIASVEDPISRYIPELEEDPRGAITVRHLLQMSGGLEQITDSMTVTRDNPGVRQFFGADFLAPLFELGLADAPGARWDYNNNETLLLTHVLTRATGRAYQDYLSEKLWAPMGLRQAELYLDRVDGSPVTSCCILSRPMDWARIGMMIRDGGLASNGARIVGSDWIDAMTTPAPTASFYGYQTWLGSRGIAPERPADAGRNHPWASEAYAAEDVIILSGFGYQRVWIVPAHDLVIVRAGRSWPENFDESAIPNLLVRALK